VNNRPRNRKCINEVLADLLLTPAVLACDACRVIIEPPFLSGATRVQPELIQYSEIDCIDRFPHRFTGKMDAILAMDTIYNPLKFR